MKRKAVRFLLTLLAVCFAATVVADGYNPNPRPIMGFMSGEAEFAFDPYSSPCLALTGVPWQTVSSMSGEVSHLGLTEYMSTHCSTPDGSSLVYGEATLAAANGDEIWLTYTAGLVNVIPVSPPAPMPVILVYSMENIVVGGTGRFDDASGEILALVFVTIEEFIIPSPPAPLDMEFAGYITY